MASEETGWNSRSDTKHHEHGAFVVVGMHLGFLLHLFCVCV